MQECPSTLNQSQREYCKTFVDTNSDDWLTPSPAYLSEQPNEMRFSESRASSKQNDAKKQYLYAFRENIAVVKHIRAYDSVAVAQNKY